MHSVRSASGEKTAGLFQGMDVKIDEKPLYVLTFSSGVPIIFSSTSYYPLAI